jgi:hypothetical protein
VTIRRGFGLTLDLERGTLRHWTMRDGVRRWVDDGTLVEGQGDDHTEISHMQPKYIEVSAGVSYWEDAIVDGLEDAEGSRIPLRVGDKWCPVIRLKDGHIMGWPAGTTADVHYKVCDQGEYWLTTDNGRVAKWRGDYVPDDFLCQGNAGFGDYLVCKVGADGKIEGWKKPAIDKDWWQPVQEALVLP